MAFFRAEERQQSHRDGQRPRAHESHNTPPYPICPVIGRALGVRSVPQNATSPTVPVITWATNDGLRISAMAKGHGNPIRAASPQPHATPDGATSTALAITQIEPIKDRARVAGHGQSPTNQTAGPSRCAHQGKAYTPAGGGSPSHT